MSYIFYTPTTYTNTKLSTWKTKYPKSAHHKPMRQTSADRYNTVFPQLEKNRKWKSVNHDNYGYVKIFNNLKKVNTMKQFNKGMSYKQKEEKQKGKVKTNEDHIVIVAAPKLDNIMINSDSRLFRKTESGQVKKNLINQDASLSLPYKINLVKVPSVHIKSKILPGGTKWIEAKNFQQRYLFQPLSVNNFQIKEKKSVKKKNSLIHPRALNHLTL